MPCTKTGALIFIEPYGEYAYGDAFEMGPFPTRDEALIDTLNRRLNSTPLYGSENDQERLGDYVRNTAYFKIVARSFQPINGMSVKHYTVHDFEEIIGASGSDIERQFWPPVVLITNNFTNHGIYGVPL